MGSKRQPRPWTLEEDDAVRAACAENRSVGITDENGSENPKGRARRLQAVAERFGRTLEAVRKRAQRIGERSYRPSWTRAPAAAREFYDVDDLSTVNRFYGGAAETRPEGGD